tara:strand:+ start:879 stop:1370 length:492 start_codon:yes stop_codon:yes gene_type:complete
MTKKVITLEQNNDGGINPKSNLFEQPIWELMLDNNEKKILGKQKMEEYLSKSYEKTVHNFKRWTLTTQSGTSVNIWCIIFTDKTHEVLTTEKLKEQLYGGHVRKDMEKYQKIEEEIIDKHSLPENPALFISETRQSLTTEEESRQLDDFRKKVMNNEEIPKSN